MQPVAGAQLLVVQTLSSSQTIAVAVQPVSGSHESLVQASPSSQVTPTVPVQVAPSHLSLEVQAFPSSQGRACVTPEVAIPGYRVAGVVLCARVSVVALDRLLARAISIRAEVELGAGIPIVTRVEAAF